jgi:hypothetical protein
MDRILGPRGRSRSRRDLLRQMAYLSLTLPMLRGHALSLADGAGQQPAKAENHGGGMAHPATPPPLTTLSPEDEQFLDAMEQANFLFFWEQANPETGLIKDRCNVRTQDTSVAASIASSGFGLTAICIAEKRGFISRAEARLRVVKSLSFLWHKLPTHRGFYFHFANINTGERVWDSEVSSVDTAILLCGVLTCRQYFADDGDISSLAHAIFDRVDWTWLSEDTSILSHGWTPELGFIPSRWDFYSELMMMYLLGMGSSSHPLNSDAWFAWKRTIFEYDGLRYVGSFAPLFVHQYSQAWFDFRNRRDEYANYFENSVIATKAHEAFCLSHPEWFSKDYWGVTASDSIEGYTGWGGPPAMGPLDGTVVPAAAAGSLPFLPADCLSVLRAMRAKWGKQAWSRYGFVDAFHPEADWYDPDVIGIDQGISVLMAENLRTGFVWNSFMSNPEPVQAMQLAGFHKQP